MILLNRGDSQDLGLSRFVFKSTFFLLRIDLLFEKYFVLIIYQY